VSWEENVYRKGVDYRLFYDEETGKKAITCLHCNSAWLEHNWLSGRGCENPDCFKNSSRREEE